MQPILRAPDEDVGRAAVRARGAHPLATRRHAHHHVAAPGIERLAQEAAALRVPAQTRRTASRGTAAWPWGAAGPAVLRQATASTRPAKSKALAEASNASGARTRKANGFSGADVMAVRRRRASPRGGQRSRPSRLPARACSARWRRSRGAGSQAQRRARGTPAREERIVEQNSHSARVGVRADVPGRCREKRRDGRSSVRPGRAEDDGPLAWLRFAAATDMPSWT